MKSLHIFGGSRGTGAELALRATSHGMTVTTYARTTAPALTAKGISQIELDALDEERVSTAAAAIPADAFIVSTLGAAGSADGDYLSNRFLIDAIHAEPVSRFVLVTSLGCGDSRVHASARLLEAIGDILHSKTRAEEALQKSPLNWTIIRPGQLIDGEETGTGILAADPALHGKITRSELARLLWTLLDQHEHCRTILTAVDPAQI